MLLEDLTSDDPQKLTPYFQRKLMLTVSEMMTSKLIWIYQHHVSLQCFIFVASFCRFMQQLHLSKIEKISFGI